MTERQGKPDNRLTRRLGGLAAEGKKALVAYLTAGDPHIDETAALIEAVARGGADVIELGVPWSDPSADGPVIQHAMERALSSGGIRPDVIGKTLAAVRAARAHTDVPIVLFGYFNPLLQRGLERVAREAAAAGVDGVLAVDLPPEESAELDDALDGAGLSRVPLLAPTTPPARARAVVARGSGFAYYVAVTGVTGSSRLDVAAVGRRAAELRPALGTLPLGVGFGVRDPASARALAPHADLVVVGTALVQAIAAAPDAAARRETATATVHALKAALST